MGQINRLDEGGPNQVPSEASCRVWDSSGAVPFRPTASALSDDLSGAVAVLH